MIQNSIGLDLSVKNIDYNGQTYKLNIWDTTGQEKFASLTNTYFRGCSGILITCDISSLKNFGNLDFWESQIEDHVLKDVPRVLVGTKSDIPSGISDDILSQTAAGKGMEWIFTSSKNNENVEEAFSMLFVKMTERQKKLIIQEDDVEKINFNAPRGNKKKCC